MTETCGNARKRAETRESADGIPREKCGYVCSMRPFAASPGSPAAPINLRIACMYVGRYRRCDIMLSNPRGFALIKLNVTAAPSGARPARITDKAVRLPETARSRRSNQIAIAPAINTRPGETATAAASIIVRCGARWRVGCFSPRPLRSEVAPCCLMYKLISCSRFRASTILRSPPAFHRSRLPDKCNLFEIVGNDGERSIDSSWNLYSFNK